MVEAIQQLREFDFSEFLIMLFIFIGSIVTIKVGIEKLCEQFGSEAPWLKAKRLQKEREDSINKQFKQIRDKQTQRENFCMQNCERLDSIDENIMESLKILSEEVKNMKEEFKKAELDKNIKKCRWDIISFAQNIKNNPDRNKDYYNAIFKEYDEYENMLSIRGISNGQCSTSMEIIQEQYKRDLESGFLDSKGE
jgi:Zn-dependent M32 family carboxypeptidase